MALCRELYEKVKEMLDTSKGKRLKEYVPDYVVYDLETTGTSYKNDSIIEISAVKVVGGSVVDEFSTLVNPLRHIPGYATAVNGISDEMVADAPILDEVLPLFFEFIGDMVLVGHNIHSFDMKFLYRDAELLFGKVPNNDYVDSLYMSRVKLPKLAHHRLVDLAVYYGVSPEGAHRALNDCRMNQQIFERLATEDPAKSGADASKLCPRCNKSMVKRNGKFGIFWGCTGFPDCRYTENI